MGGISAKFNGFGNARRLPKLGNFAIFGKLVLMWVYLWVYLWVSDC